MLSSRKLFKQGQLTEASVSKKIETDHQPKVRAVTYEKFKAPANATPAELKHLEHQFKTMQSQKNQAVLAAEADQRQTFEQELAIEKAQFLEELAALKAETLQRAESEINELKERAYSEGFKQGEKEGVEAGFTAGELAGKESIQADREKINELLRETHESIKAYKKDQQADLIDLASKMAAKILQREISLSEQDLYLLVEPLLRQLNTVDNFVTIYVRKNNVRLFQQELEKLKQEQPALKYIVLADETLPENGCVLETDYEVIDLDLAKQLERISAKLNEVN